MAERYRQLYTLPGALYAPGSPVVIAAGRLLGDALTGKVLAQLKLVNIERKPIKAATVRLTPLDTKGAPLGDPFEYQYLDLDAGRDAAFGQNMPVAFSDARTRACKAEAVEAVFADNSVWKTGGRPAEPFPDPVPLDKELGSAEMAKQFRLAYGDNCVNAFRITRDLWRCPCGAVNHHDELKCHACGKELVKLAGFDREKLAAECEKRVEAEKAEAAERARKNRRRAAIIVPAAAAVLLAAGIFGAVYGGRVSRYNEAAQLLEAGKYDEAAEAFAAMEGFRDSEDQVLNSQYLKALSLAESGRYDDAIELLTGLGGYGDSAEQLERVRGMKYDEAVSLIGKGRYAGAVKSLEELGEYRDSAEIAAEIRREQNLYDGVVQLMDEEIDAQDASPFDFSELGELLEQLDSAAGTVYLEDLFAPYRRFVEEFRPLSGSFETVDESETIDAGVKLFDTDGEAGYEFALYGPVEYKEGVVQRFGFERLTVSYTSPGGEPRSFNINRGSYKSIGGIDNFQFTYNGVDYAIKFADSGNIRIEAEFTVESGDGSGESVTVSQWRELRKVSD